MRRTLFIIFFLLLSISVFSMQDSKDIYNLGRESFKSGAYSSAELLFRKALKRDDSYRDKSWFYLARSIYRQGKYRSAIFEFNSFLTKCRTEVLRIESRFWMGESYYRLNERLKSIEEFKRFVSKSKNNDLSIKAYDRIGSIYYIEKRYDESIIEFKKSIKISNDRERNAELIYKIGRSYFENNEFKKAEERISPLIYSKINDNAKMKLRILLGRIYQNKNDHKKAIITFNTIPRKKSGKAAFYNLYYYRAISYNKLNQNRKAKSDLEIFSSIASKSDLYYDGLFLLGKIQLKLKRLDNGLELLDRVWKNSNRSELVFNSSIILATRLIDKDPTKTIFYVEKFINIEDSDRKKNVLALLARAYLKNSQFKKCETTIDNFIKTYPFDDDLDEMYFLKARLYLEKNDTSKASIYFNKIKEENPFSKYINDTDYYLALLNYKKENYSESIKLLKGYSKNKNNKFRAESIMLLLKIYISEKKWNASERLVKILLREYRDYNGMESHVFNYAVGIYNIRRSKAKIYLNKILKIFPYSEYSMLILQFQGDRNYEKKRYEDSIKFYVRFLNSNTKKNRGLTFYRLLNSYYLTKKYERVVGLIKREKFPPLSEDQWKEIPLIHARSQYKLKNYKEVYSLLKWDNIKVFSTDDALMLIRSTIETGDIKTAEKFIIQIKNDQNNFTEASIDLLLYFDKKLKYKSAVIFLEKALLNNNLSAYNLDLLKIKLTYLHLKLNEFEKIDLIINSIKSKKLQPDRYALEIIYLFSQKKIQRASSISIRRLNLIRKSQYKEEIYKLNIDNNFKLNNLNNFLKFSKLYSKYDKDYISFLSGKMFYMNNKFKKSFYNFYRVSSKRELKYYSESNYYLAMLNLLFYKNQNKALKYFIKSSDVNKDKYIIAKSKIEMARIYHEKRKFNLSKKMLNNIISMKISLKYINRARSLKEFYKY